MNSVNWSDEKRQLTRRLPRQFVLRTLQEFNSGRIGVPEACQLLHVGKTRLYQLRTRWLQDREAFQIKTSGGDHRGSCPTPALAFLREFVPLQTPCNFQLVADELLRLYGLKRARFGELFQHDSSIQWWQGPEKQTLRLALDDHSGLNIAGRFITRDTIWAHFLHFREAFERFGIPQAIYTDGLSLFGPSSSTRPPRPSQRVPARIESHRCSHLVAPSPRKPKEKSNAALAPSRNASSHSLLMPRSTPTNAQTKSFKWKSNAKIPRETLPLAKPPTISSNNPNTIQPYAPSPPTALLDLRLSLRTTRKVAPDHSIEFEGRTYKIARTLKKSVTVIYHPQSKLWVLEEPPNLILPNILGYFSM